jgi:hypothetical protein
MIAAVAALLALAFAVGCSSQSSVTPSPVLVVASYLGDMFMPEFPATEPVANIGFVVRDDRTVQGAAFFSAPAQEADVFFTGTVDSSNALNATGRLIGSSGTTDIGAFTIRGTFGNFAGGYNIVGSFTAQGIGSGSGTWGAFYYTLSPLGSYMGNFTGDRAGQVALMVFRLDDVVMMIEQDTPPRVDFYASSEGSVVLTAPTTSGGPYGLTAQNGFYGTDYAFTGSVAALQASGAWQLPATPTALTGTWSATRPQTRAAAGRAVPPGPIRVHRRRR